MERRRETIPVVLFPISLLNAPKGHSSSEIHDEQKHNMYKSGLARCDDEEKRDGGDDEEERMLVAC